MPWSPEPNRSVNDAETGGLVITDRPTAAMVSCVALGDIGSARTVLSTWPPRRQNQTTSCANEPSPSRQPVCNCAFRPQHASIPSRRRLIACANTCTPAGGHDHWHPMLALHFSDLQTLANSQTPLRLAPLGLRKPLGPPVRGLPDFLHHRRRWVAIWPD